MEPENSNTKKFAIKRILRLKPIVLIRNNIVIFSVIFLFSLSLLIGIWNIKTFEIFPVNCKVTPDIEKDVNEYFGENVLSKNFFSISNEEIEAEIFEKIPYIKTVKIEKEVPNRISIFISVFEDTVVSELSENKCHLLSSEGYLMKNLCDEEEASENCCNEYAIENEYIYFNAPSSILSVDTNGKERFLVMSSVGDMIKVVESYNYKIKDMKLDKEILYINDVDNHEFVFDLNDDIQLQLQRFVVVMGKIQSEEIEFKELDLRFERPVVKN